jgi:hypothetical protein
MVLVLTATAFLVPWIFDANVDAQGGAYATGVLVLISSAAIAVTLAARRASQRRKAMLFGIVAVVFVYTTGANVWERPDGVKIGACFIAALLVVSFGSRVKRAFELRVTEVELDKTAQVFVRDCARRQIRLVANEPDRRDAAEYSAKIQQSVRDLELTDEHNLVFVEVTVTDPSDFESRLEVHGEVMHGQYRVLTMRSTNVPNTLAALLLEIRDITGCRPHVYLDWTEGNPLSHLLRYIFFGVGEVAPVTREILRRAEPDPARRPHVHAG